MAWGRADISGGGRYFPSLKPCSHHREAEKANAKLSVASRDGGRKMPGCSLISNLVPITAAEIGL